MTEIGRSLRAAFESLQAGDLRRAEHACRQVLERVPEQPEALHLLGVAALRGGDHEQAIRVLERAARERADSSEYLANLGAAYGAAGRHDEAAECLRRAIRLAPRNAQHHYSLGITLRKLDRLDESAASYRSALAMDPTAGPVHDALGRVLRQQGRLEAAAESFRHAIEHQPGLASAHDNLGSVLRELGDPARAVCCHRQAVRANPRSAALRNNLAVALKTVGDYPAAANQFSEALRLEPANAEIQKNLAKLLQAMGKFREATIVYENAHRLRPEDQDILFDLMAICAQTGDFEGARRRGQTLLRLNPDHPKALALLSDLTDSATDDDIRRLLSIVETDGAPVEERIEAGFALGNAYDRQGSYDTAFRHYAQANRLRRDRVGYDADGRAEVFRATKSVFSRTFFERSDVRGSDSERPIFIVGMPRSGTTLVEQILSSHPQIHGAGELNHLKQIALNAHDVAGEKKPYPWNMEGLTQKMGMALAEEYLAELRQYSDVAKHVTDKLPANFLYLGLVAVLFPRARVIHCRRHPLDVCLSCYFQSFIEVDYSFDLEHLGGYFRQYVDLMAHWREVLPLEMFEVQYEELVDEQERVSRALFEHCGLEWDERCLEFHKNDRAVKTASLFQVRRPMYRSSVGRWRRYEQHLAPLKKMLDGYLP